MKTTPSFRDGTWEFYSTIDGNEKEWEVHYRDAFNIGRLERFHLESEAQRFAAAKGGKVMRIVPHKYSNKPKVKE